MNVQSNLGMQVTTFDNPMGVDGFEFMGFSAPDPKLLHDLFPCLGFTAVARHKSKKITLYRQGNCNFLVNEEPDSFASAFAGKHGPCACGFAIRFFRSAEEVREQALAKGGRLSRNGNRPRPWTCRLSRVSAAACFTWWTVMAIGARCTTPNTIGSRVSSGIPRASV